MDSGVLIRKNKKFPRKLLGIEPKIEKLYWKGNLDLLTNPSVAMVGSRKMSSYGERVIEKIVPELVNAGVVIISGFMYGVDQAAHRACLENGGHTIAVFGWGIDWVVSEEDSKLYQQILDNGGLMISEYEADLTPQLWMFPRRNRIVSGLSDAVIVVEAASNSGTLITANLAVKQGRKLFAVPGPITSSVSVGANELIKTGKAKMIMNGKDVLDQMDAITLGHAKIRAHSLLTEPSESEGKRVHVARDFHQPANLKAILAILEAEDLALDDLARILKMNMGELGQTITMMEMEGKIERRRGKIGKV
jgi:DNA processing protein